MCKVSDLLKKINMFKKNLYSVPPGTLHYHPHIFNTFSSRGQEMVEDLVEQTPSFHKEFNLLIPIDEQRKVIKECFLEGKRRFLEKKGIFLEIESWG